MLQECAGRGVCDFQTEKCTCFPGYAGDDCFECASGYALSVHGTCDRVADACQSSPDPCMGDCSGSGICNQGQCLCDSFTFGRQCADSCPAELTTEDCACCPSGALSCKAC